MSLFVDVVKITVKAGNGGNGCVSFHREKFVQAGGPDGGDGGKGGSIVFVATSHMHTLMDFRYKRKFEAENGSDGMKDRRTGKSGADCVIEVPVGTLVKEADTDRVLLDLNKPDERRVLVKGGNGGFGNQHFGTATHQTPNFAKPGEKREVIALTLELKSIADVGLVGFPNVGKSTMLSVVTSARPKIANYHFTTLNPNLGIVKQDEDSFVMADIPGLVEGASEGVGLGHDFLRHIERTRMLIHVIDVSGSESRDPIDDFNKIMKELELYGELSKKPMIVAANKLDLPGAEENLEALKEYLAPMGIEVFPCSAATNKGFSNIMRRAAEMLKEIPEAEPFYEEQLIEMPTTPIDITFDGTYYIVTGSSIDHLIDSVNFGERESLNYFHRCLRKWGIIDELRQKGAKEGDTILINDIEFDFVD